MARIPTPSHSLREVGGILAADYGMVGKIHTGFLVPQYTDNFNSPAIQALMAGIRPGQNWDQGILDPEEHF